MQFNARPAKGAVGIVAAQAATALAAQPVWMHCSRLLLRLQLLLLIKLLLTLPLLLLVLVVLVLQRCLLLTPLLVLCWRIWCLFVCWESGCQQPGSQGLLQLQLQLPCVCQLLYGEGILCLEVWQHLQWTGQQEQEQQ
jgi:hypothetical protein